MIAAPLSSGKDGRTAPTAEKTPQVKAKTQEPEKKKGESTPFQKLLESLKRSAKGPSSVTAEKSTSKKTPASAQAKGVPPKVEAPFEKEGAAKSGKSGKLAEALRKAAKTVEKPGHERRTLHEVKKKSQSGIEATAVPVPTVLTLPVNKEKSPQREGAEKEHAAAPSKVATGKDGLFPSQGTPIGLLLKPAQPPSTAEKAESRERPRDRKLTVVDLRSAAHKLQSKVPASAQPQSTPLPEVKENAKTGDSKSSQGFQAVFQTVSGQGSSQFTTPNLVAAVPQHDLATLHRFLNGEGAGRIADQARIVLRDNNRGEIRLTLYPETLGKVKIALNLNGHHLDGRIFVENQGVKDVFQQNLNGLMQAFRDSGWSDLALQVSVGGEKRESSSEREGSGNSAAGYGRVVKSEGIEAAPAARINGWTDRLVNLQA